MRKLVIILAVTLLCGVAHGQESQRQRLEQHLYTLASDSLRGREAGTDDGRKAADYIVRQWEQMGLKPMFDNNYRMPFKHPEGSFTNLVALIEGNDPLLKDEYIVMGAHYDHVGVKNDKIYNGADDNASGSSCLLEIARQLLAQQNKLKRSVIICAFDAEEAGLIGSNELVKELRRRDMLDKVKLMMSVDMVGWYKANGELVLEGTGTIRDHNSMLSPKNNGVDIKTHFKPFENSLFTATDTGPFAEAGIPTLAVTTGLKTPYHKPEDDADLIDYEGLDNITNYLVAATMAASQRDGKLASGRLAPKHSTPRFEIGLIGGYNTSYLVYPDATFTGKPMYGGQGGLTMQYNFNENLTLRTSALYLYSRCPLPAADDAFGQGYTLEQHTLMVPLILQLGVHDVGIGVFAGLGGYFGYTFNGQFSGNVPAANPPYSLSVDPHQMGWVFNFGMRLGGRWQVEGTWYNQIFTLFDTASGMPRARKNTYTVTLGYYF